MILVALLGCVPREDPALDTGLYAEPWGAISGEVRGPVVANVTTVPHGYEATTSDGVYAFDRLPPATYELVVAAEGYATRRVPVELADGDDLDVDVVLEPARAYGDVVVTVSGPDGPLAGIAVSADGAAATTGSDGVATLPGLGGLEVDVTIAGAGYWERTVEGVVVPAGATVPLALTLSGRPPNDAVPVGSAVCATCHPDEAAAHAGSAHAQTLSGVVADELLLRFVAGEVVTLADGTATLGMDGATPTVTLASGTFDVAGLLGDPRQGSVPYTGDGIPLPVAWRARETRFGAWPATAAAMLPFESDGSDCLGCHTTNGDPGVGCEACHGNGSAHVAGGAITRPDRLDADEAMAVCAGCHGQSPDEDLWPSGAAASAGHQADELRLSPHGEGTVYEARCHDCHDPHGSPQTASLRLSAEDNRTCLSCHAGLTFGDDPAAIADHDRHIHYEPAAASQRGRCTACHMPRTAARIGFHEESGAGDLASHLFWPRPPQDAVDAFTAAGTETLAAGEFPVHGCVECHAYGAWRWSLNDVVFPWAYGPVTEAGAHRDYQAAFEGKFQ